MSLLLEAACAASAMFLIREGIQPLILAMESFPRYHPERVFIWETNSPVETTETWRGLR